MKSVAFHNLGCKVNAYEMEVMQQILQESGYRIVPFDSKADVYIINTCTVTNIADRKSRQMLHRVKKQNPEAVVVAAGCYVQTGAEAVEREASVDIAIGNNNKSRIAEILDEYWQRHTRMHILDINHTQDYECMQLKQTAEHTRAYMKVQDGCNQFCSYCAIPLARGRVRSRSCEDALQEARGLAGRGYRELVVTGIHLSSYGMDFKGQDGGDGKPADLQTLLTALHEAEGIERIRLGSLEPRIITEEFVEKLRKLPKVCPHFHLSLQSGCNETLVRMNRHYTTGEYLEKVELLRSFYEHPAITTDVIVGFPGETEEEFAETCAFLDKVNFSAMHVFKYSRRANTRAAVMPDQLPEAVKAQRSGVLLSMNAQKAKAFREYYFGRRVELLLEEEKEIDGRKFMLGHTREYVKTAVESDGTKHPNQLIFGKPYDFLTEEIIIAH